MKEYSSQEIEWQWEEVREIFWESKGLGRNTDSTEKKEYVRDTQCPRCNRWGSAEAVASHIKNYPDCASDD